MATTTNFGWETPDDTDLVKDGAAAIRTALGGVDTSFVDLKGGTTGQVLAKATNTDLDFTWVAQDDSNAIQNAIVDAKGDLISATAADTPARLAVGANDTVLTADSSTATGLKWAAPAAGGGMTLIATVTLSGASTTLSSIPGTYKSLVLFGSGIYGSTNGEFVIKINGGTDTWHSYIDAATLSHTAQTAWKVSADKAIGTGSLPFSFYGQINNYAATSPAYKPVQSYGYAYNGSTQSAVSTFGGHRNTSAITSLEFDASGDGTGTILVYGVN